MSSQNARKNAPKPSAKRWTDEVDPFRISLIKVSNFKNFKKAEIELKNFNVIVGKNASGKSNLFQIFAFLRDIAQLGLAEAVVRQGGAQFITNFSSQTPELKMEVHFSSKSSYRLVGLYRREQYEGDPAEDMFTMHVIYSFAVTLQSNGRYKVLKDVLEIPCSLKRRHSRNPAIQGRIIFSKNGRTIKSRYDFPSDPRYDDWQEDELFGYSSLGREQLLIESRMLESMIIGWPALLDGIELYNFDPAMLKRTSIGRSPSNLKYDGSNLAAVLYSIKKNPKVYKRFQEIAGDIMDFYYSFSANQSPDGTSSFSLKEKNKKEMPSAIASDGTVSMIAIIIVLFLEENQLTAIEEPEKNIHPGLLAKMISHMEDASRTNQIIISMHNPRVLDHVNMDNVSLVIRDEYGSSTVVKPASLKTAKQLAEHMQMGEEMIQNMLEERNA